MPAGHVSRVRKLYKLILRLHRNLPDDLRVLGDLYAKEEFKRHKKCKPDEARIFLYEWQDYAAIMLRQAAPARAQRGNKKVPQDVGLPRFGHDLPPESVDRMTPDQLFNLYMLLANARGDNPIEPVDQGIGLVEADGLANNANSAKKYIFALGKVEKEKLARGEIGEEDVAFQTSAWLQLFELVNGTDGTYDGQVEPQRGQKDKIGAGQVIEDAKKDK